MSNDYNVKNITIIGSGTMGREIAQVCLMAGYSKVYLNDLEDSALKSAKNFIADGLNRLYSKNKLANGQSPESFLSHFYPTTNINIAAANADFIIEAIPEVMELKQNLFQKLHQLCPPHTIFATNTSTMSISEIAKLSGREEKVIGMHFFTPVPVLQLIEVIRGKKTSDETVKITKKVGNSLPCISGKRIIALIEKESPGFIVNRLNIAGTAYLSTILDEAINQGYDASDLDADMSMLQGRGPYEIMDYLGLDTVCNSLKYLGETINSQLGPGETLCNLVDEGKLGRKVKQGLHSWDGDDVKSSEKKQEGPGLIHPEDILAIQLNEGCRLLEAGIVSGYKVIDKAMMAAMRTPGPFAPGKRKYLEWVKRLEKIVEKTGKDYYLPCELMRSGEFKKMR